MQHPVALDHHIGIREQVLRVDGAEEPLPCAEHDGDHAEVRRKTADGWTAPFLLPCSYLSADAELHYAGNVHVAQGRTVDTAHVLVSETISRRSLYVALTRGRECNIAHAVTGETAGYLVLGAADQLGNTEGRLGAVHLAEDGRITLGRLLPGTAEDVEAWSKVADPSRRVDLRARWTCDGKHGSKDIRF